MDGACTSAFPLINAEIPSVFTYICPTHSLDNFLKNICSDKPTIRVKGISDREFAWGESFLANAIEQVRTVVSFVTGHQKVLARYRGLCESMPSESRPQGGMELLRACDTRFASNLLMLMRYQSVHGVLELLVIDPVYTAWMESQPRDKRGKAAECKTINSTLRRFV